MTAPKRRCFRFSLATLFVVVTVFGCGLGYELNWLRQRRALKAEGDALRRIATWEYANFFTTDEFPPKGSTVPRRVASLLGEPDIEAVYVFYIIEEVKISYDEGGWPYIPREPEKSAKVRRAMTLFPESTIVAVFVGRHMLNKEYFGEDISGIITE